MDPSTSVRLDAVLGVAIPAGAALVLGLAARWAAGRWPHAIGLGGAAVAAGYAAGHLWITRGAGFAVPPADLRHWPLVLAPAIALAALIAGTMPGILRATLGLLLVAGVGAAGTALIGHRLDAGILALAIGIAGALAAGTLGALGLRAARTTLGHLCLAMIVGSLAGCLVLSHSAALGQHAGALAAAVGGSLLAWLFAEDPPPIAAPALAVAAILAALGAHLADLPAGAALLLAAAPAGLLLARLPLLGTPLALGACASFCGGALLWSWLANRAAEGAYAY